MEADDEAPRRDRIDRADDVWPDPDADLTQLDRDTLRQLRSLGPLGDRVGRHLITAAELVDEDPDEAMRQLRAAVRRGSRLPVVRETAGAVGYAAGDFAFALRELRTASRLGVGDHLLPLIVDCERALGRPDRALELAAESHDLDPDTAAELAIVVSGIHRDLGNHETALAGLELPAATAHTVTGLRLRYARAEALLAAGDREGADALFARVAREDADGVTDAAERVAELGGLSFDDLGDDDLGDDDLGDGNPGGDDPEDGNPGDGHLVDRDLGGDDHRDGDLRARDLGGGDHRDGDLGDEDLGDRDLGDVDGSLDGASGEPAPAALAGADTTGGDHRDEPADSGEPAGSREPTGSGGHADGPIDHDPPDSTVGAGPN